jgi:HSP20 family protein
VERLLEVCNTAKLLVRAPSSASRSGRTRGEVVTAELPGLEEKDFGGHDSVLTLRGEKRSEQAGEREGQHFTERVYGAFRRGIELPVEVQSDKASASFKNGVLAITLPKSDASKVRSIPVTPA